MRARLQSVDPSLEEAARDLGSSRLGSFLRITLPSLAPGIVAGALLAFTLSLDEFVIAFFTNGPTTPTLPQVIYSNVRFGVKPDVNALASVLLLVSTIAVLSAQRLTRLVTMSPLDAKRPHGGRRSSGFGKDMGHESVLEFTVGHHVMVKHAEPAPRSGFRPA